jgi:predicted O-methyltransferase YrrM
VGVKGVQAVAQWTKACKDLPPGGEVQVDRGNWTPEQLLKVSGSYWSGCALHAAVKLNIFSLIGDEALMAEDIARRLGGDLRGVTLFLNGLAAMGLLIRDDDRYANSPGSKAYLVKDSPQYLGYIIMHHHDLVPAWAQLARAVQTGQPVNERTDSGEERESFLMGMFNMAMGIAPKLAKEIDLKERRHLLDLGGGPGTYAVQFCLANPHLEATVYDLPTTQPFALRIFQRFGVADRVSFMPGDYLVDDIEGSYDVAWLSQILHGEGPGACERIIEKAVSVLERGGLIMVHEFILDDALDSPLFPALFALNMLVNTEEGRSYSESQIRGMLSRAGVKQIRRLPFKGPNDSGIISGTI